MILLILFWTAYFACHSLLASLWLKRRVSMLWPAFPYRLFYNILAVLLLLPGAWLLYGRSWAPLWTFRGNWLYFSWLLQFSAVSGFLFSLRYYDMKAFMGLTPEKDEGFTISPLHRHVRHPWYCLALVFLWSSSMNAGKLATAIMMTIYFVLGSMHEESMLIERFGNRYAKYRERVPGLVPLPWKYLSEDEAGTLVK
ncbi:MAG TPA: hypothetical protein PLK99_11440 [Burkholderiales bacterium]|nr:hypothetical protein [Burkholderiales bacterium]